MSDKDRRTRDAIDSLASDLYKANKGEKPESFYREKARAAHERGERTRENNNR